MLEGEIQTVLRKGWVGLNVFRCLFFSKSKLKLLVIIVFAISAIAVFYWQPANRLFLQGACLYSDGKWASNGDYCIHRQCARDKSCKPSYRNIAICESLQTGIAQNELYFHLGMPVLKSGDTYYFAGGGAAQSLKAVIENGVVIELDCGA
ncbi:MAG: hypothetical protein HWE20_08655 [Gammaproteobacteria bacterium]|nr:hypothetical protein [Gammaproteobacteria bacterium]